MVSGKKGLVSWVEEVLADGKPRTATDISIQILAKHLTPEDAHRAWRRVASGPNIESVPMFLRVQRGAKSMVYDALIYLVQRKRISRDDAVEPTLFQRVFSEQDAEWLEALAAAEERARAQARGDANPGASSGDLG